MPAMSLNTLPTARVANAACAARLCGPSLDTATAPAPAMAPLPALPGRRPGGPINALDEDGALAPELDISFSTHLTVVVPVRVEFDGGAQAHDVDLVIPRSQCRDRRPRLQSLLDAVQPALGRAARSGVPRGRPRALLARVAGQWQALCAWPAERPGHALHAA